MSLEDDRRAVESLLYEYARRVDAGDFDGVGELFGDATFRSAAADGIVTLRGAEEVADTMRSMVRVGDDGTPGTKHLVSNVIVEIDGDVATVSSYFTVLQALDGELRTVVAGRYDDRFERAAGEWRFADRLVRTDLVGDVSRHLRVNPFGLG